MYTLKYEKGRKKNLPTTPAVIIPSFKRLFFVYLKYQMHISKDTTVDIGGANPIIYNEELSI